MFTKVFIFKKSIFVGKTNKLIDENANEKIMLIRYLVSISYRSFFRFRVM
ncbi:MAG: hypothetical protein R3Y64_04710 [Peptostreptococcaceae bacterium]